VKFVSIPPFQGTRVTIQPTPQPNPLAHDLHRKYGAQLLEILQYVDCTTVGVSGLTGAGKEEVATDEQCKWLRINFSAEFPIKITRDLAQQVLDGLEKQQEYLAKDIERLRAAVESGKFPSG
jgi:hypothetical protein